MAEFCLLTDRLHCFWADSILSDTLEVLINAIKQSLISAQLSGTKYKNLRDLMFCPSWNKQKQVMTATQYQIIVIALYI